MKATQTPTKRVVINGAEIDLGSLAENSDTITQANVIDTSLDLLERWAKDYFPNSLPLQQALIEETQKHVLELHEQGCLSGNPKYELYLSHHSDIPNARAELDAQLVEATMESALYHHFIHPETKGYENANFFLDHTRRKEKSDSGKLQALSDILYFVTQRELSGTPHLYSEDLDQLMVEARERDERNSQPLLLKRNDILRAANWQYKAGGSKGESDLDTDSGLRKYARDNGISKRWASRLVELKNALGFTGPEILEVIDSYAKDPAYAKGLRADYKETIAAAKAEAIELKLQSDPQPV